MLIQPVVLSGGAGTRLWPMSRESHPKQLLMLVGDDSLLQATVRRVDGMPNASVSEPIVVCNYEYRFVIAEQLRLMNKEGRIVLEPFGRNTAPALTLAALEAQRGGLDPILLVMPADHIILDNAEFQSAVLRGAMCAEGHCIVTFGITPDCPETGYGYIQTGTAVDEKGTCVIARFVEKPDSKTAQCYLDSGDFLWNSGVFMMRASVWGDAIRQCRPDVFEACRSAWESGKKDGLFLRACEEAFGLCPSDSIDYAVMEQIAENRVGLPTGLVIPLSAGWSDVGAWDSLWKVLDKDEHGNASQGDVLLHDCSRSLAISSGRLVACIGLDDVVVVETPDAILVSDKVRTQEVKKVVENLKNSGRSEGNLHRKVFRPWGAYDGVDAGERFLVKRIVVNPGAKLSLQMHYHRAEHWIVVSGTARVTRGEECFFVSENESTFIPLGTKHRLENPGLIPLEIIEVQSGSYLGEDDIVRFDDTYGRF